MLQANHRVGDYVLSERLSQSALDEVWRAHHHMWPEQLALVKIATHPDYVNNLRRDGIRVHRLVHPNVIRPLGFDPAAQPPYLIAESIAGGNLSPWISGKQLTVEQATNVLRQVLAAIQFGHEKGIVHGDIRPENIFLEDAATAGNFTTEGSVKVSDFGVGLAAAATVTGNGASKTPLPGSSLAYIAPENRGGTPPDVKSDIYAMGVLLFEMLTGECPTGAELPSELNPIVPPGLDDVFRKSYARRERRFESAKIFLAALSAVNNDVAPPPPAPPPRPAAAPSPGGLSLEPLDFVATPPRPTPPAKPAAPQIKHEIEGLALSFQEDAITAPSAGPAKEVSDDQDIDLAPLGAKPAAAAKPTQFAPRREEPVEIAETPAEDELRVPEESKPEPKPEPSGPVLPTIAHVPSRAERNFLYDEMSKKQIRNAEDVQGAMKFFVESRRLDEGELANIRLRVVKWAEEQAGGQAEMREQITLTEASARPFYTIKLLMRTTRGDEAPRSQTLEHPAAASIEGHLPPDDYRLMLHLSADTINEKLMESTPQVSLRSALMNMSRTVRREFIGRIQREDVLIYRCNVIVVGYRFDEHNYRLFMVGNALRVVPLEEPFTRIRQEPTKRAAALLDGKQIDSGLKELRRGLESEQWQTKSNIILNALRGKLAAAYMVEAKQQYQSFLWLESLEMSRKAGRLSPSNEEALAHGILVRKRIRQIQFIPGFLIFLVLIGLSVLWGLDARPATAQVIVPQIVTNPFFVAGVATLIATLWARSVLGLRMARTDFQFFQAMLLPLFVALAIAPANFPNLVGDAVFAGLLALGITANVLLFKYFPTHLLRPPAEPKLTGQGPIILNRIETMLQQDWELIRPHYMSLAPLYSFTSVQTLAGDIQFTDVPSKVKLSSAPRMAAAPAEGDGPLSVEDAALSAQIKTRVAAAARGLVPLAKSLISLAGDYAKAKDSLQTAVMQATAVKIEQKGQELSQKLADFDILCETPVAQDRSLTDRMSDRMNDPDIQLLRSLARCGKTFQEDEKEAMGELTEITNDVQQAIERLRQW